MLLFPPLNGCRIHLPKQEQFEGVVLKEVQVVSVLLWALSEMMI